MEWSEKHDAILCREILLSQQFNYKSRTVERGKVWEEIAERLDSINDQNLKFQSDRYVSISSFCFLKSKQKGDQRSANLE